MPCPLYPFAFYTWQILPICKFFINFPYSTPCLILYRRAAMGHTEQSELTEEAVLADDHFPAIALNQPFRVRF